jgi:hypothetical protein
MKYWVFFLLGFVFLGYSAILSIFLGIIGAIGGGWTIAWWRSLEVTRTQILNEIKGEGATEPSEKVTRKSLRKPTRHYRRKFENKSGSNPFRFW